MVDGFLLINVKRDSPSSLYRHLANFTGITTIAPLYGEYDLIIQLTADTYDTLGNLVLSIQDHDSIENAKFLPSLAE